MPEAVLSDVPASAFTDEGEFLDSFRPQDLVYFCLNEGDGDSQLILIPQVEPGPRKAIVIDVCSTKKMTALVEALRGRDPNQPVASPALADPPHFPLIIATHPHDDHISGMGDFLSRYGQYAEVFWEPGFRHPTPAYQRMMAELSLLPDLWHLQPTSGTTAWIGQTKVTVLSPSIGLRNLFDSYGVDINDSSISTRIEFPASAVAKAPDGKLDYAPPVNRAALVLGADSQALSWAQVLVDYPRLESDRSPISEALRKATGADFLSAPVFKVSHHCSNRGSYLELIQKINPRICLVTADPIDSHHGFPHMVALEGIREAVESTATSKKPRSEDHELGIHVTGARDSAGEPLGSIALVMRPGTSGSISTWRFGDDRDEAVVLGRGRRFK